MSTTRLIALFSLKPGVDVAAYEDWARTVDLPTVNGLPSIAKFEVFRATALLGSDEKPPYDYIEIIDVRDMGQFGTDVATPVMTKVAGEFQGMANVIFVSTEKLDWPGAA